MFQKNQYHCRSEWQKREVITNNQWWLQCREVCHILNQTYGWPAVRYTLQYFTYISISGFCLKNVLFEKCNKQCFWNYEGKWTAQGKIVAEGACLIGQAQYANCLGTSIIMFWLLHRYKKILSYNYNCYKVSINFVLLHCCTYYKHQLESPNLLFIS